MHRTVGTVWLYLALLTLPAAAEEPYRFRGISNLPLIIIDTANRPIPNDPKIGATMSVIDHGDGKPNSPDDPPTTSTRIRIEVRGSSSQMFDKKPYGFETVDDNDADKKLPLLGLPAESDWILYGPYSDKSLMRNYLVYGLSNKIGRYAPRARFAELFLRDSSAALEEQYAGVYLLIETIKRGTDRVDVSRLRPTEGNEFSGGYIVKVDRVGGPETYFTSELGSVLGFVSPRGDRLNDEQRAWIKQDFSRMERALAGPDFLDPQNGYHRYLDADSFVDCFLLNELFKNVDSYFLSTFLHKRDDGKLAMGPIWDFDLSSGNASYGGVWKSEGWMLFPQDPQRAGGAPFWWDRLFEDPAFRDRIARRWRELRLEPFSESALFSTIDETAGQIESAQRRNFERWPTWGTYVWPNPRPYAISYAQEIRNLKTWFTRRIEWVDANIDRLPSSISPLAATEAPTAPAANATTDSEK
ncbi:MAG: spore coat protein CotH [Planctomycetes bacterium]|nr:spore coat protein CotH [Planctomycetota bacterium]